jgi:hypothetical protein
MTFDPVTELDPEVVRRVREVVLGAAPGLWPSTDEVLAIDRGRGLGSTLRWRVGNKVVVAACSGVSLHPYPIPGGTIALPLDDPDPDLSALLPAGVVHLVEVDHDLELGIPVGPPPTVVPA